MSRRWSGKDDYELRLLWPSNSARACAKHFKRTVHAIYSRVRALGIETERLPVRNRDRRRGTGGGNYLPAETIARIAELHHEAFSLREIARALGISRESAMKYAPRISRSLAMKRKHLRWKASGKPVLPPWRRGS